MLVGGIELSARELRFIDFCSGIGGGRLGLESAGFQCLGFSEIDKEAIITYKRIHNIGNDLEFGDLTLIDPDKLPDFDILLSGFPCQSFSIIGKREGLQNKEKGGIIFDLVRILKAKQPRFFILENVKGLVNHEQGKTIRRILDLLQSCCYKVYFKVLNSIDFGLPHSRERIYFVGIHKDINVPDFDFQYVSKISDLRAFLGPKDENIFERGTTNYQTFLKYLGNKYNKNAYDLNFILKQDFLVLDTRQSDLRIYENKVPTLRRDRQGLLYVYRNNLYRLSALEALRLQGFDVVSNLQQKIKGLNSNHVLRQCGNAMSVNVVGFIANKIRAYL